MAPRNRLPGGPVPVDAIRHEDKRLNIPTADSDELLTKRRAARCSFAGTATPPSTPNWSGRARTSRTARTWSSMRHRSTSRRRSSRRCIIENLRRVQGQEQLDLFDDFDGLSGYDAVEYYQHEANWSNRMILGDSLQVMASLAEKENLRGKVQMIYIDPPYGIKFGSNWQVSTGKRDVKDGKLEDTTREVEQIKAFRDTWELGIHSYLAYLARSARRGPGSANRIRQRLRPDRRRERPPRPVPA